MHLNFRTEKKNKKKQKTDTNPLTYKHKVQID